MPSRRISIPNAGEGNRGLVAQLPRSACPRMHRLGAADEIAVKEPRIRDPGSGRRKRRRRATGRRGEPEGSSVGSSKTRGGNRTRRSTAPREACRFPWTAKAKARRNLSLPLSTYSALGGLPQGPGHGAESSADAANLRKWRHDVRVLWSTRGGRGDVEPVVGPAVRSWALGAEVWGCAPPGRAKRPAEPSRGRHPEMRTCPTGDTTDLAAPVIRSAAAVRRSAAASEVSQ